MRIGQAIRAMVVTCLLPAAPAGLWGAEGDQPEAKEKPAAPFETAEVLRYMPDNCHMVGWFDVAKLRDCGLWQALFQGEVDSRKADRVMLGSTGGPSFTSSGTQVCNDDFVAVLVLKEPLPPSEVTMVFAGQDSVAWHEEVVAGVTMHVQAVAKPVALFYAGEKTVVYGTPQLLRDVLTRGGPAQLPEPLMRACRRMDQSQTIGLAVAPLDFLETSEAARFLPEEIRKGMDAILFEAQADAGLRFRVSVLCAEGAIAQQLHGFVSVCVKASQALGPQAVQPPEAVGLLTSMQSAVNDHCLVVQGTVPPSLLKAAATPPNTAVAAPVAVSPYNPGAGATVSPYQPVASPYMPGVSSYAPALKPYDPCASVGPGVAVDVAPKANAFSASPTYPAPTYPVTPYPPYSTAWSSSAGPCPPATNPYQPAPAGPAPQADMKQQLEILTGRCAELQRRLQQVEQDRDLLAERVTLYLKQLEAYRQQLEPQPKQGWYSGSFAR